jgi:transcriptional regulator with XRE-family HTH domain
MGKKRTDPVMARIQALFKQKDLTLDELGKAMGYKGASARAHAWQFISRTHDPRVSMLRKFAKAVGVDVADLFRE